MTESTWVGIDGEGVTIGEPKIYNPYRKMIEQYNLPLFNIELPPSRDDNTVITGEKHLYISMSYRDRFGKGDQIENREGLSTLDCLGFICSIPEEYNIASYGFGYDIAKILNDLPPELIYLLTHLERRTPKLGKYARPKPITWNNYEIDLFNSRFTVIRKSDNQKRVIHDLSKFYQAKFVSACKNWNVGTPIERDTMRNMKADRRNLVKYTQEQILDYSNKECVWLAELADKLDEACESAQAPLNGQYFGAGSIAKSLMRQWKIKDHIGQLPNEIKILSRFAFFGGRFEIAIRGKIEKPVHDWDISSAYPYQIYNLPCLKCGNWTKTNDINRTKASRCALVQYSLQRWKSSLPSWGPFPFRDEDGTIPFPIESAGGWLHKDEFFAGQALFPNVKFLGAWVYETNCGHRPFEKIRDVYLERLRIGKEGPGIVLKLGANAIAGSIMQTIGRSQYHCPVWAGMITSGTRAQLLEMLGQHENWSDVIMMATDGLWGLKEITPPKPLNTETDIDVYETSSGKKTRKPLGGWEHGEFEKGVFMARPGIYFPLDLKEINLDEENEKNEGEIKDLKARGIGIGTLYRHRKNILAHYERTGGTEPYIIGDADPIKVIKERSNPEGVERFVGIKSGIIRTPIKDKDKQIIGEKIRKRDVFGLWTLQKRKIDFKALPKRTEGDGRHLMVRSMPSGQMSFTYDKMASKMSFEERLTGMSELGFYDDEQDDWAD